MVAHAFYSSTQWGKGLGKLCEFKAIQVYRVNSRTAKWSIAVLPAKWSIAVLLLLFSRITLSRI